MRKQNGKMVVSGGCQIAQAMEIMEMFYISIGVQVM